MQSIINKKEDRNIFNKIFFFTTKKNEKDLIVLPCLRLFHFDSTNQTDTSLKQYLSIYLKIGDILLKPKHEF